MHVSNIFVSPMHYTHTLCPLQLVDLREVLSGEPLH